VLQVKHLTKKDIPATLPMPNASRIPMTNVMCVPGRNRAGGIQQLKVIIRVKLRNMQSPTNKRDIRSKKGSKNEKGSPEI
jgi:hypothetical protein